MMPVPFRLLRARGLTLIELLVVIAVMSAVTLASFSYVGEDRAQIRHDDTQRRLEVLRRAIVGSATPVWAGEFRLSGFVSDNGVLPENLQQLVTSPAGLAQRGVLTARFDRSPLGSDCSSEGSDVVDLAGEGGLLVKGHRGDYLAGLAVNGVFRDGWGNRAAGDDVLNFGWRVTAGAGSLAVASLGAHNELGNGVTEWDTDRGFDLDAGSWSSPLGGWTVRLVNRSGADIVAGTWRASLLVFRNDSSGGRWLRYTSTPFTASLLSPLVSGTATPLAFAATGCYPGDTANTAVARIPAGRHVLVLVQDSDTTPHNSTDGLYSPGAPSVTPVSVFSATQLPDVELVIR
ncbi:type II secretion system protein [Zoogloea sp.]|uniref:type II secretion system protein n=1 Tax=Zoogloea sp. TaxID=49181 RepID=UPI001AC5E878|nr:type II secretion system protein [Zoogloea sp.]MBN8284204.1 prepilin-type N-terminal cleavage/methylation domain-containing protein [Zoogloea sp.]